MLEIIAWIGCVMLVLKGADIYLGSLLDEYPDLRRLASLFVLVISVILAGVFAIMIVRQEGHATALETAYQGMQDATVKSFEETSRALETTTAPARAPTKNAAGVDAVTTAADAAGAAMAEDSGE